MSPKSLVAARRVVLDNGLAVIARPNPATRSVAVHLILPAGSGFDSLDKPGAAAFVSRLLDRGAGGLTAARIAGDFENLGAAFLARTRLDGLDVTLRMLPGHLPFALERLRVIVSAPEFPAAEVEGERARILTDLAERDCDTTARADDLLAESLFPEGHPYHAPIHGTRAGVQALGRDDLVRFHAARCIPRGAVLVIAGQVTAAAAHDLAARHFASWTAPGRGPRQAGDGGAGPAPFPDAPPPAGVRAIIHPIAGKTQADVALGFVPAVRRRGPDLQAALVMNSVLGEFGIGGRLGLEVRENAGLAYYAHSYVWAGLGAGPVVVRAGVATENVVRATRLIRRTLARFLSAGIKPKELADSKQAMASVLPRRFETNAGAAGLLADSEYQGLGFEFPDRVADLIHAVDRHAAEDAARRYVTLDRQVLVVAGADLPAGALD
ncbi:MAG TPA: pitrilysin family protein [Patescibacteria group bacterium]|nr:pitrilysin family protein [Patescibacteria group bacterium]